MKTNDKIKRMPNDTSRFQGLLMASLMAGFTPSAIASDGIYMGSFAGQGDNGGFAMFVLDGKAEVVGYNAAQDEGVYARNVNVLPGGSFTSSTVQGGSFSGSVTGTSVNGTFQPSFGSGGSIDGGKKSNLGDFGGSAGFYEGTYSGPVSGSAFAILAADGTIFFYIIDNPASPTADGDGGGKGTVSAGTFALSATVVPSGTVIAGTLNPSTNQIVGNYSLFGFIGTFTITRTKSFPDPPTGFAAFVAGAGLTGDDALPNAIPFGDGAPNLLKYAFNMDLSGPDASTMVTGGSSGLPIVDLDASGETIVLRLEFIRRKEGGLIYTPQKSTSLDPSSFQPMNGTTSVTEVDDAWERVVVEEPFDPATNPRYFSRVSVNLDPPDS